MYMEDTDMTLPDFTLVERLAHKLSPVSNLKQIQYYLAVPRGELPTTYSIQYIILRFDTWRARI